MRIITNDTDTDRQIVNLLEGYAVRCYPNDTDPQAVDASWLVGFEHAPDSEPCYVLVPFDDNHAGPGESGGPRTLLEIDHYTLEVF